jgi:hypothetical protein
MFASMGPRMRFITATKLGRADVQKLAAIEMVQAEWRLKLARKRLPQIFSSIDFLQSP